jgi:transcriptional regulator with XRE-family HTH domain
MATMMMSFSSNQQPFHLWMKQRRAELDLSRAELADLVGCSLAMVRQLEQGRRRPSRQLAERLARFLQVAPEDRTLFLHVARTPPLAAGGQPTTPDSHPRSEQAYPQRIPSAPRLARRSALPTQPDQLIGRERELQEALALIGGPSAQLLTLIGPGGVGKTRLGIQLAYELRERYTGQAYFIGLAALSDAKRIPHTIAQVLQLLDVLAAPSPERLIAALRDRELLLLLDNLEHLPDSSPLIAALIESCPGLKIIVTSRSALRLRAEILYPVPPLALPPTTDERRTTRQQTRRHGDKEQINLPVSRSPCLRASRSQGWSHNTRRSGCSSIEHSGCDQASR